MLNVCVIVVTFLTNIALISPPHTINSLRIAPFSPGFVESFPDNCCRFLPVLRRFFPASHAHISNEISAGRRVRYIRPLFGVSIAENDLTGQRDEIVGEMKTRFPHRRRLFHSHGIVQQGGLPNSEQRSCYPHFAYSITAKTSQIFVSLFGMRKMRVSCAQYCEFFLLCVQQLQPAEEEEGCYPLSFIGIYFLLCSLSSIPSLSLWLFDSQCCSVLYCWACKKQKLIYDCILYS